MFLVARFDIAENDDRFFVVRSRKRALKLFEQYASNDDVTEAYLCSIERKHEKPDPSHRKPGKPDA
jgi:hypothetical protein